jgi:hypothetical protein
LLGYDTCRDAAALAEFWCWLEEEICKTVPLTEVDVAEKLLEFRQKQDGFIETSFDTISGMIFLFWTLRQYHSNLTKTLFLCISIIILCILFGTSRFLA